MSEFKKKVFVDMHLSSLLLGIEQKLSCKVVTISSSYKSSSRAKLSNVWITSLLFFLLFVVVCCCCFLLLLLLMLWWRRCNNFHILSSLLFVPFHLRKRIEDWAAKMFRLQIKKLKLINLAVGVSLLAMQNSRSKI